MLVSDIMNRNAVSIFPNESVLKAAELLKSHNIGSLPVCDEKKHIQGIVTDRDIVIRCVAADKIPGATPVSAIMTRRIVSVSPDVTITKAAELMSNAQIRRLPVIRNDKLIGMLSLGDMAKNTDCEMEAAEALTEISLNIKKMGTR